MFNKPSKQVFFVFVFVLPFFFNLFRDSFFCKVKKIKVGVMEHFHYYAEHFRY